MGGFISNLRRQKDPSSQEVLHGKFQASDGTLDESDEPKTRRKKCWEVMIYDKRVQLAYVFILGIILGFIIPMILFMSKLESEKQSVYGSCLINLDARFQCLINSAKEVDEDLCMRAQCCWENSNTLPFKCYHSLPSAYHYSVNDFNDTEWTSFHLVPNLGGMSNLNTEIRWESETHLVVDMYNPKRDLTRDFLNGKRQNPSYIRKDRRVESMPFNITHGAQKDFFFLKVVRMETNETIFDTRLGPIMATDSYISFATILPTKFFYGLKGGQGALSTLTYGTVNGFETMEFPFYMSYEQSGMWHGVFIEVNEPLLAQVVQAPGIFFHLESDVPEIKLHFFSGPQQENIIRQYHEHIRKAYEISHLPVIPPYWGLGLHLCRKIADNSSMLHDLKDLLENNNIIPYDSDCIDEYLRHPVHIDVTRYQNLSEALNILKDNSKKLLLTQKVTALVDDDTLNTSAWLIDTSNASDIHPFNGLVDNKTVKYLDFFHSDLPDFPVSLLTYNTSNDPSSIVIDGISLSHNFPILYNASGQCQSPETRIQFLFFNTSTSSGLSLNSTEWGTVCPEVVHQDKLKNTNATHRSKHNIYGEQSLKLFFEMARNINKTGEMLISSDSVWTTSMYYGSYNGLQVPFSWQGLQESVSHTVRNYMLAPISGTPICGTRVFNLSLPFNEELCLRWFQFGLLLPISRNSYDGISSFGPARFSAQYKDYLRSAIRMRYSLAPYYYTTLRHYQLTLLPFIRPMSFQFNDKTFSPNRSSEVVPLLNQFMIGEAILATPIIERGITRMANFPPGIWYTKEGLNVWDDNSSGGFRQITGYLSETPIFLRGGFVIPIKETFNAVSLEETLRTNYTLLTILPTADDELQLPLTSRGSLAMKVDETKEDFHEIHFIGNYLPLNETFHMLINSTCAANYDSDESQSTIIQQVRILGFPPLGELNVTVKSGSEQYAGSFQYYGDHGALRLHGFDINLCPTNAFEIIVTTVGIS